jgi:hypothetical protein
MYVPMNCKAIADELFTDREQLYGKLTPERILDLISRPDAIIRKLTHSSNNYGTFYFITFEIKDKGVFEFYGMGENDMAESFQRDFKEVESVFQNPDYNYRDTQAYRFSAGKIDHDDPLQTFKNLIHQNPKTSGKPKTGRGRLFLHLEELTDSDDAQTMLQDNPDMTLEDLC